MFTVCKIYNMRSSLGRVERLYKCMYGYFEMV